MSINSRLNNLEAQLADVAEQLESRASVNLFASEFRAVPENDAIYRRAASEIRHADMVDLLHHPGSGELRRTVGAFCRERRIHFPGARLIRARYGNNIVLVGPSGVLLQIWAEHPINDPQLINGGMVPQGS